MYADMTETKCAGWLTKLWNHKILTYEGWNIDFHYVPSQLDTKKYDTQAVFNIFLYNQQTKTGRTFLPIGI